jgi:hypothetical protein
VELEPGWWLRDEREIAAAALPLSDRVEWAVFSLLSTSGGSPRSRSSTASASMFRGHDTPDEALVRACLDSYRSRASTPDLLRTHDQLQARYAEHTELAGLLWSTATGWAALLGGEAGTEAAVLGCLAGRPPLGDGAARLPAADLEGPRRGP